MLEWQPLLYYKPARQGNSLCLCLCLCLCLLPAACVINIKLYFVIKPHTLTDTHTQGQRAHTLSNVSFKVANSAGGSESVGCFENGVSGVAFLLARAELQLMQSCGVGSWIGVEPGKHITKSIHALSALLTH